MSELSGIELVEKIKHDAFESLPKDAARMEKAGRKLQELLIRTKRPKQSTIINARENMFEAQRNLVASMNIIDFFNSLDPESHVDSAASDSGVGGTS